MESFSFPQFLPERSQVYVRLYTNVTNAAALRRRIVEAATARGEDAEREREAVNFAFIDARLITSRLHLQTAIYQAILTESQNSLRTRTVHSEVLWALNPTNNITEAIRRYGVSDNTTALLVVKIGGRGIDIGKKMEAVVAGAVSPLTELKTVTDWSLIKRYHKLENERNVDEIVTSTVAMKSVIA